MLHSVLFCSLNTKKKDFPLEGCLTAGSHDDQMKKEFIKIYSLIIIC